MDAVSNYFASNPSAFTLLAIFLAVVILYSIVQKMIKFAIVVIFIILLFGGVYLFKDPANMPGNIKQSVETFKNGSEQIGDKFSNLWNDTKELAGKMKKAPGDINKMLDTSKKDADKL